MRTLNAELEIEAPAERVWELLTDFASYPDWNPFMFSVEGRPERGARLRIAMQRRGGTVLRFRARVLVADAPRELAWVGEGPWVHLPAWLFRGERRILIEPLAGRRSLLRMRTTFTGLLSSLLGWLDRYAEAFAEMETALKARAEGAPAKGSGRKERALELFEELPRRYDELAAALSFFQDTRWRKVLVAAVGARPGDRVLDVATGTGLVAKGLVRRDGCRVVGLDQSAPMLTRARRKLAGDPALAERVDLVEGEAESLPFADDEFDHLTFTYLLRYVDDPVTTLRELARVVKPGGCIVCAEFCLPRGPWLWVWRLYTRAGLPALGRLAGRQWYGVGRFLGPSIEGFYARYPLHRQLEMWREAGIAEVTARRMSLGGGVVIRGRAMTAERPAFYALARGGWRDLVTILHPPYTLWHLSYVALGAAAAPQIHGDRLTAALGAFFLAVGVSAHALDEFNGRPLRTQLSDRALISLATVALAGALAIGVGGILIVSATLIPFVLAGGFAVLAYNLELFGGRFHTDFWFAAAWGAFPALTGWWSNALAVEGAGEALAGVAAVLACFALSVAQRRLSNPVRELRRGTASVHGEQRLTDGSVRELDQATLAGPLDGALRALSVAVPLLAVGLVAVRL